MPGPLRRAADRGLVQAAEAGDEASVAQLLGAGACPDAKQGRGRSRFPAIVLAAAHGHAAVLAQLEMAGADINARTANGLSLIHI